MLPSRHLCWSLTFYHSARWRGTPFCSLKGYHSLTAVSSQHKAMKAWKLAVALPAIQRKKHRSHLMEPLWKEICLGWQPWATSTWKANRAWRYCRSTGRTPLFQQGVDMDLPLLATWCGCYASQAALNHWWIAPQRVVCGLWPQLFSAFALISCWNDTSDIVYVLVKLQSESGKKSLCFTGGFGDPVSPLVVFL